MAGPTFEASILGSTDGDPQLDYGGRYEPVRSTGGRLEIINYVWDPDTLDYIVMTDDMLGGGGGPGSDFRSDREQTLNADDLTKTITYLDEMTSDRRVGSVDYASVGLGFTFTLTVTYGGSSGNYYPTDLAWS